jgi:SAM-dependent methyltransferase
MEQRVSQADWTKTSAHDAAASNGREPAYPLEYMVRLFSSSNYSKLGKKLGIAPLDLVLGEVGSRRPTVLDVGSGYCNHARFFLEQGFNALCVDVNADMCDISRSQIDRFGFQSVTEVMIGDCENVPVEDGAADVTLLMRSIHYAGGKVGMCRALDEARRVTRKNGFVFVQTIGDGDDLRVGSERVNEFEFLVSNYEFRSGKLMALFDSLTHFEETLKGYFSWVETGELLEQYPGRSQTFSHYTAMCRV